MKRITLVKSAIDFAFANFQLGAVDLAEKSIAAFKAAGGVDADLPIWDNTVKQNVAQCTLLAKQKLPSEQAVAQAQEEVQTPKTNAESAVAKLS